MTVSRCFSSRGAASFVEKTGLRSENTREKRMKPGQTAGGFEEKKNFRERLGSLWRVL